MIRKTLISIFVMLATYCQATQYTQTQGLRVRRPINQDWKYFKGDSPGAEQPGFDDAAWQDISVPHSFSSSAEVVNSWYRGIGWYRKRLPVSNAWNSRRVFLEFEAAFQHAWVYVNGTLVGEHKGGYTAFSFDVTDTVKFGATNLVAVKLGCEWEPDIAPRAGEHQFSGGIYRDVYVTATAPAHVTFYGTDVSTPFNCPLTSAGGYTGPESFATAPVSVRTEVRNDGKKARKYTVRSMIVDASNQVVEASMKTSETIVPGAVHTFFQSATLNTFRLWSPSDPYLYSVKTELLDGGTVIDACESPLGIRWFQWTATNGFFLNGSRLALKGFNVHQDHAGWCDGVVQSGVYRDVKMCKDAGSNIIRGSHYPHNQAFSAACDKLGLLYWSELCFWGIGGFNSSARDWHSTAFPLAPEQEAFKTNCTQTLKDMIRQHRNHPSIIVWSLGNEVDYTDPAQYDALKKYLAELSGVVHADDPQRPSALGMGAGPCGFRGLAPQVDVAGYNGDGMGVSNPGHPNIVSEYGSPSEDSRPGPDRAVATPGEYPWRAGSILWCGFHHGSHYGMGRLGCVDYDRIPHKSWFCYREAWTKTPKPAWPVSGTAAKIQLTADIYANPSYGADGAHTVASDGTEDVMVVARIVNASNEWIDNNVEMTLKVTSGKGRFFSGESVTARTPWGLAGFEFRPSGAPGPVVITATAPGLAPSVLTLTVKE
ncbi:MAG: glycoside hydrolase family 2 TIM barrel-domain containing protein [bacterium]